MKIGEFLCNHFNIKMEGDTQHFQHIRLYYFKKGKNTTAMQKQICAGYGEGAVPDRMGQSGLQSFVQRFLTGCCSMVG